MKIENLKKLDPTFEVILDLVTDFEIDSITDLFEIKKNCLVFVKNKKFMSNFLAHEFNGKKVGLILEKKYGQSLQVSELENLKNFAAFIGLVEDVNISMSKMSKSFYEKKYSNPNDYVDGRQMGTAIVHPTAFIAQSVFIGENVKIHAEVKIHPGCVLMSGVEINEGTEIYPNTTIYRNVYIGKNCRIHGGCTIGADGFGYNFSGGEHLKVWHFGSVKVFDNVEIGANSCVDSGTFSATIIGEGTKIDNLVQIGHNSHVGKKVIICGHVALAGSCILHDFVVVGGKSAISNGIEVGTGAQVAAFSGVTSDVPPKGVVGGFPARDFKEWMRGNAMLRKLSLTKNKES
jgi:UDP-3-O-[3-hydroxymyristoyl] glucosamine N-acyltransferase